nr:copia protein [Tanacetum cinerariifolium]
HHYKRGTIDKTLFLKKDSRHIILVQVYVDDIIFGSMNKAWCDEFKVLMKGEFEMSAMGELTFFLGLQVKQFLDGIFISQDKYVKDMLKKFNMESVRNATTPYEVPKPKSKDEPDDAVNVYLPPMLLVVPVFLLVVLVHADGWVPTGSCTIPTVLLYKDDHNKVAYLEKGKGKQFWATTTVRTHEAGPSEIIATIDDHRPSPRPTFDFTAKLFSNMKLNWDGPHMPLLAPMLVVPVGGDGADAAAANEVPPPPPPPPPVVPPTHSSSSNPGPSTAIHDTLVRDPTPVREPTPMKDPIPVREPTPSPVREPTTFWEPTPEPPSPPPFLEDLSEGGGYVSPPKSNEALPTTAATAAGGVEDSVALTNLSLKLDRCLNRVTTLENDLGVTKKVLAGAVLKLVSRVKRLEGLLHQRKRRMVLSNSEGEEAATKEKGIDLDAFHKLASMSLGGDTTVEAAYTIYKASQDAHASSDAGHDEDEVPDDTTMPFRRTRTKRRQLKKTSTSSSFEHFHKNIFAIADTIPASDGIPTDAQTIPAGSTPIPTTRGVSGGRMGRDTVQLETAVNTISQEYLLEFTSEYGIPEALHPELPGPEDRIIDFPEGKQEAGEEYPPVLYQAFGLSQKLKQSLFWVDERVFPTVVDWRTSAPKDGMPAENTYSAEAVRTLDTHRTPIQKQPEVLLCLVGISRRYYLGDEVYPTFLHDDDRGGLIRAPNPTKVKTGSRPRAAHEVPLLIVTANRVIEMEDPAAAIDSLGVPSTIERSPLDFANEAGAADQETMAPEVPPPEDVPTTRGAPEACQTEGVTATDPSVATESRKRGHDRVDANAPPKVLRRDHADPRPTGSTHRGKSLAAIELGMASTRPVPVPESAPTDGTAATRDPEYENASFAFVVGSPKSIYRPQWGVANGSMLDTPEACQDLVDHVTPPGYFSELRHLHNDDFLRRYNVNLARQVAMGSQLIQAKEHEINNPEALLEAEADMKKAAEEKNAKLSQELENMRALLSDLQVSNNHLSQQVATLQEQVSGDEKLKAAFEEFKRYEDNHVEQRCAEMDARLDALSIDSDEEQYPHMLTAIAGRRWMIGRGLRLAVMKCGECLELRQAFADVVSAGIAKGMSEGRSLKYPLVDQLKGLKDAPMDVIMAALYLKSDTGDDVPQQEEMLLADAITASVSRAEKKKKCRMGLAILLADAATQTKPDEYICTSSVLHAPWESLRIPNVLGMALRIQSPRPPGLQPVYAENHA